MDSDTSTMQQVPKRNWIADGGWAVLIGGIILTFGMGYRIYQDLGPARRPHIGNGVQVESYQFDLSNFSLDRQYLAARGGPKDMLPALIDPGHIMPAELGTGDMKGRGKYVVKNDRVIGVTVGGESRAYPVLVMNWHEVVNDTLGGVPIAVTYSPLTDSAVVFERTVGGEVLNFGVSGLVYRGNTLLYDRRDDPAAESLWLQLGFESVSGPASGTGLTAVASAVLEWQDWVRWHPETTIVARDPDLIESYKKDPYGPYFQTAKLDPSAGPLPADAELTRFGVDPKSRVLLLYGQPGEPGEKTVLVYDDVLDSAAYDEAGLGTGSIMAGDRTIGLHCRRSSAGFSPDTVWAFSQQEQGSSESALPCSLFYGIYAIDGEELDPAHDEAQLRQPPATP